MGQCPKAKGKLRNKGVTMKTVIKKVLVVTSALLVFNCDALESTNNVSETDLSCFFESIEREGTNYVFTARWSFRYSVNENNPDDRKFCKAGEKIMLSEGSELVVVERHHTLKFSPTTRKNGRKGFRISQRKSHRTVRGTSLAYLVPADEQEGSSGGEKDGSSGGEKESAVPKGKRAMVKSAGAPEEETEHKCLKGLTLLPCEE